MPVSFKHKLIFIHIPKNAGTSIRESLIDIDPDVIYWRYHHTAEEYNEFLTRTKDFFKFTFVRNPWDRTISHYLYLKCDQHKKHRLEAWEHIQNLSFEDFIMSTVMQLDWLKVDGNLVPLDFIGRVETFDQSIAELNRLAGIKLKPKHLRKGADQTFEHDRHGDTRKDKHYSNYYTPKTRKMVEERFHEEIKMFGYRFESEPQLPLL